MLRYNVVTKQVEVNAAVDEFLKEVLAAYRYGLALSFDDKTTHVTKIDSGSGVALLAVPMAIVAGDVPVVVATAEGAKPECEQRTIARRPRGNYTVGNIWISYGPRAPLPDNTFGCDFLTKEVKYGMECWVPVDHPDMQPLTPQQYELIIAGLCSMLVKHGVHSDESTT